MSSVYHQTPPERILKNRKFTLTKKAINTTPYNAKDIFDFIRMKNAGWAELTDEYSVSCNAWLTFGDCREATRLLRI
jgi:hypothetical protein